MIRGLFVDLIDQDDFNLGITVSFVPELDPNKGNFFNLLRLPVDSVRMSRDFSIFGHCKDVFSISCFFL